MYNNTPNPNDNEQTESTLFTAPEKEGETLNARRKKSALKKQRRTVIVLAIIIAVALVAYFFVVLPIVNHIEETPEETVELLDGEVLGTNNRILLFEKYDRDDVAEIKVHNEFGEFGFYYDTEYEKFFVTDHPSAPYSEELFASLLVNARYTVSTERVHKECDDMEQYGLADEQTPAWFTITVKDGTVHKVYIGDRIPSGDGYYARYDGRSAVYVLDASVGETMLAPIEALITPQLVLPMAETDYVTVKNFALYDSEKPIVAITYSATEDGTGTAETVYGATSVYSMLYPGSYSVNAANYASALASLISLTGNTTLKYAPEKADLEAYGLTSPAYGVDYEYKGIKQTLVFSERTENDTYYVYSPLFDLITEIDKKTVGWVENELIDWVDPAVFMMNINDVKTITVESEGVTRIFDLQGSGEELVVTERESGFEHDVQNFRQFYKLLITVNLQGYAAEDISEDEIGALTEDTPYLALTVETRSGKATEFKFYPYSTRRAYYTVNGEGEFYVMRDRVTKVITDCENVMTNTTIDAEAHS